MDKNAGVSLCDFFRLKYNLVGLAYSWKHTLINLFALVNNPKVVCFDASGPNGTMSFNFSKQVRRCARLKRETKINTSYAIDRKQNIQNLISFDSFRIGFEFQRFPKSRSKFCGLIQSPTSIYNPPSIWRCTLMRLRTNLYIHPHPICK